MTDLITKEQAIEILEAALANPRYLANSNYHSQGTNYFCSSVLMVLLEDDSLTMDKADEIAQHIQATYIYPSINECLFLKSYLARMGLIDYTTVFRSPVYKKAAHEHWSILIESLKVGTNES